MFHKIILILLTSTVLFACPFDEENKEVTIEAHKAITNALKQDNFSKVKEEIVNNKILYEYFSKESGEPIYTSLVTKAENKDILAVRKLLDRSLVLEIKELLVKVENDFDAYMKSRLLLIKTKKHLKALTKDKQAHVLMKKILKSIGNPGLMGVGKKPSSKEDFFQNRTLLLAHIQ